MTYPNSNRLPVNQKLLTRLFEKIAISTTCSYNNSFCWEWQAGKDKDGYGKSTYRHPDGTRKYYRAHRLFYDLFIEIIPPHLVPDHLCRNVSCCNPAHMEPVTVRINTLRGVSIVAQNAKKTHCPRNHPYTPENCLPRADKRDCRICANLLNNERRRNRTPEQLIIINKLRRQRAQLKRQQSHLLIKQYSTLQSNDFF